MLFHTYELYNNGLFFYEEMFRDLKRIYFDEKRHEFVSNFYNTILDKTKIQLRLIDLKSLYDENNFPENLSYFISKDQFSAMVDSFEFVVVIS